MVYMDVFMVNLWVTGVGMVILTAVCLLLISKLASDSRSFNEDLMELHDSLFIFKNASGNLHDARDSEPFDGLNSVAMVAIILFQWDYRISKRGPSIRSSMSHIK